MHAEGNQLLLRILKKIEMVKFCINKISRKICLKWSKISKYPRNNHRVLSMVCLDLKMLRVVFTRVAYTSITELVTSCQ